jgi:DNA-binding MarR family transcriptional regulator
MAVDDDRAAASGDLEGEDHGGVARIDLKGIDQLLGYHLRMAQVAFQRRFDRAVQGAGLSQVQFAVLWLVDANPGASQVDLASVIGVDRAGMMAIIDRLELRNLVVRRRSQADRRRRELYLTEDGARLFARCRIGVEGLERGLRDQLSEREAAALVDVLRRIRE